MSVPSRWVRAIHTFTVATELPAELSALARLGRDLSWSHHERVRELFAPLDPGVAMDAFDPVQMLASADPDRLATLAADAGYVGRCEALLAQLEREAQVPGWFHQRDGSPLRSVAYFSPEFGIAESLPQYSGGLGVLAGDHLRAASDLGVPLTGVGLFYRHGYFRQRLDRHGWQRESYPRLDPRLMALDATGVTVGIDLAGTHVLAQVWRATVGRVTLYLLDTDVEGNDESGSAITDRLYGGSSEQRIRQEIVLGVGGVRALRALGIETQVFHMNEGHAGFLALERVREEVAGGLDVPEAIEAARTGTVFTTHTPVAAGIDRFDRCLVEEYFSGWMAEVGVDLDGLMLLGHEPGTPHGEMFNLACMGLRLSERANGVARLHGEVSRHMFTDVWPDVDVDEVPIGHVTNGVHVRSWTSPEMSDLYERRLGSDWHTAATQRWEALDDVSDAELWANRRAARERLVAHARRRVRRAIVDRGMSPAEAAWADTILDPDALTIGFARRFATYKRATLVLSDRDRLRRLLSDPDRPVQLLFAGKAHPADDQGKRFLQEIFEAASDPSLRHRLVVLDDYDIAVGRVLYHGVDVWLNNPRRPMEACGTSGMKVVLNGALNLSVLDGWWDEMFDPETGWAVPSFDDEVDLDRRDEMEADALLRLLEDDVVPMFFRRDADATPTEWLAKVRASITRLGPRVTAARMVRDYVTDHYEPAAARADHLLGDDRAAARSLAAWKAMVRQRWEAVRVTGVHAERIDAHRHRVCAEVTIDGLAPDDVDVQVLCGPVDADDRLGEVHVTSMAAIEGRDGGVGRYEADVVAGGTGTFGVAVRVVPSSPELASWAELGCAHLAPPEAMITG